MEIHQFVVVTKENPANYTREDVLDESGARTGTTEITAHYRHLAAKSDTVIH